MTTWKVRIEREDEAQLLMEGPYENIRQATLGFFKLAMANGHDSSPPPAPRMLKKFSAAEESKAITLVNNGAKGRELRRHFAGRNSASLRSLIERLSRDKKITVPDWKAICLGFGS